MRRRPARPKGQRLEAKGIERSIEGRGGPDPGDGGHPSILVTAHSGFVDALPLRPGARHRRRHAFRMDRLPFHYGSRGDVRAAVDEHSTLCAKSIEGARRVAAERGLAADRARGMGLTVGLPLPGIMALAVRPGSRACRRARRIFIHDMCFAHHRDDVVIALIAAIARPRPAAIYNIAR